MANLMQYRRELFIVVSAVFLIGTFTALFYLIGLGGGDTSQRSTQITAANGTPTPDPIRANGLPSGANGTTHTVVAGETLAGISGQYGVGMKAIIDASGLQDPNNLVVGQQLVIPGSNSGSIVTGTSFKLIPDSELVYGPGVEGFSAESFIPQNSYLRSYRDTVDGITLTGVQVVQLVAERTRVNPRLLIAALEHRSGWVTQSNPNDNGSPMGLQRGGVTGLYQQLEWAANQINKGYYGRSEGGLTGVVISDGSVVQFAGDINDGTAGVQNWLGAHSAATRASWENEVGESGFITTYERLFGSPFNYTVEGFYSPSITQPELALPWSNDEAWYFTGGPHGGWAGGSAWASLDFVPPGGQGGCYESTAWITAVADGTITRSSFGAVELDLDGDGYSGTGWAILYQHVATNNRVAVGTKVRTGDRIGHPSCEGGFSTGTHLHLARTYNGRWVSADQPPQFNLSGWVATGTGSEYNGNLTKNSRVVAAFAGRGDNLISAER